MNEWLSSPQRGDWGFWRSGVFTKVPKRPIELAGLRPPCKVTLTSGEVREIMEWQDMQKVKVVRAQGTELPKYQTDGSAGVDLEAQVDDTWTINPGRTSIIPTGIKVEIPPGYELQIRPRSGLAVKGILVANSPGTIDSDFRGVVRVILLNLSGEPFQVTPQMRIAQAVLAPVARIVWEETEMLNDTVRGEGGFGSTG